MMKLEKALRWKKFILLGVSGAGKTTQAKLFEEFYGYKRLSSGDMIREKYKHHQATLDALKEGKLAPDEEDIRNTMLGAIYKHESWVLDGFPRTVEQMRFLADEYKYWDGVMVMRLMIKPQTVVDRLIMRNRDMHDSEDTSKKRVDSEFQELLRINNHFGYLMIEAEGDAHSVTEKIIERLQAAH